MSGAARRRAGVPVPHPALRARRLLARGGADQHRRHPDHRQPHRQYGVALETTHDRLRGRARRRLHRLVRERTHAVDPHDLHDQARGVLLARDPLHLRPRHRRRRPLAETLNLGYWKSAAPVRRRRSALVASRLPVRPQRGPRVLDRLHPHPPARRVDRRLPVTAQGRRRPRSRARRTTYSSSPRSSPWSST